MNQPVGGGLNVVGLQRLQIALFSVKVIAVAQRTGHESDLAAAEGEEVINGVFGCLLIIKRDGGDGYAAQVVITALHDGQKIDQLVLQTGVDVVERNQAGDFEVLDHLLKRRVGVGVDVFLQEEHLIAVLRGGSLRALDHLVEKRVEIKRQREEDELAGGGCMQDDVGRLDAFGAQGGAYLVVKLGAHDVRRVEYTGNCRAGDLRQLGDFGDREGIFSAHSGIPRQNDSDIVLLLLIIRNKHDNFKYQVRYF